MNFDAGITMAQTVALLPAPASWEWPMTEYVMEYDGWAEGIPVGEYLKVRDAMHARKRE